MIFILHIYVTKKFYLNEVSFLRHFVQSHCCIMLTHSSTLPHPQLCFSVYLFSLFILSSLKERKRYFYHFKGTSFIDTVM